MLRKLLFTLLFISGATLANAQDNGSVCFNIFNDMNANGTFEESEPGIEGITISVISSPDSYPFQMPYSQVTDQAGNYCFTGLPYGGYMFQVEPAPGWIYNGSPSFFVTINEENEGEGNSFRFGVEDDPLTRTENFSPTFAVYPNPANDVINFDNNNITSGSVSIYDMAGKCVIVQELSVDNTAIGVSTLLPGIYIAKLTGEQYNQTIKFAVSR